MDRAATDVAASPASKGDLPSFEELLAEGSFQARIARARADREKALALDAGQPDDFVLNTSKKPWEKDSAAAPERDRAVDALTALGAETATVHPFPRKPRDVTPAGQEPVAAAPEPRAETVIAPAAPRVAPVAVRQAVIQALKSAPGTASAPALPVEAKVYQVPPVLEAPAQASARSPRRRAMMVAGGFAAGLALGIAATVLPARFGDEAAQPGRVALAPAASSPGDAAGLATLRNPVIVAAAPAAIAPAPEVGTAALSGTVVPGAVPAARRAAPETIAPVSLDAAPAAIAAGPGVAMAAPASPAMPAPDGAQPAVVALAPAASPIPVPPALSGEGADTPPAAQPLPAAFTPREAPAPTETLPAAPAFEGRLVVHAPDSVPEADFGKVLKQLEAAGYPLSESSRVPFTIKDDNVRYFHAEDAALAAAIAEDIGARARDFTSFSPAPPAGTIEIWLSGKGSSPVAATKRTTTGSRSAADQKLQALRSRILNQLRNGDHL